MKKKTLRDFRNDESGGILAFTLLMFMVMLVGGGMAVDFINYEYRREGVQDALDRGVLAAAALGKAANATSEEEIAAAEAAAIETVRAYVRSGGFDPDELGLVVTPDFTLNSQLVAAISNFSVDTYFLRISGIDTLNGGAASSALVSRNQIELSLVVDISGSMAGTKIADLRDAATNFVTTMLEDDRSDYTTLSLVPFSAQVRPNDNLIAQFNLNRWQTYGNCVDFDLSDYDNTNISRTASLTQAQHWRPQWVANVDSGDVFWCPPARHEILPWSNSIAQLTASIDQLTATGNTAAYLGMKWGTGLLDSDAQPVLTALTQICSDPVIDGNGVVITPAVCDVDPAFDGRPAADDDDETLKFVILMTDGANTGGYRIKNWQYDQEDTNPDLSQENADYWNDNIMPWSYSHLEDRVTNSQGDTRLQNICTKAKDAGIIVFTIGYDVSVDSNPYNQMRSCASSFGHFYNVETDDLNAAFTSIAQTIQKLKLVN